MRDKLLKVLAIGALIGACPMLMAPTGGVPPPVRVCNGSGVACVGTGLGVGRIVMIAKASNTTLSSTTTLATDTELQITSLPAGRYKIEGELAVVVIGGGFKWAFSSTGATAFGLTDCSGSLAAFSAAGTTANSYAAASVCNVRFSGILNLASVTSVGIQWAQVSSDPSGTQLLGAQKSFFQVTRIS